MFRETDRQVSLLGPESDLSESARRRLEESWARPFLEEVYPVLLEMESEFADLYNGSTGRPVWSVARKLGVCILQEMFALDDQRALDALSFDVRWQYALGFGVEEDPYLSRRSLCDFRRRLVESDPQMERIRRLFERIAEEAVDSLDLSFERQRIDSTLVASNMRTRGRIDLIGTTLMHFLKQLEREHPALLDGFDDELVDWFLGDDEPGWFGKQRQRVDIEQLGRWLVEVIDSFDQHQEIKSWESFELVERVLAEHFEVDEPPDPPPSGGDKPSEEGLPKAEAKEEEAKAAPTPRKHAQSEGATLQSPYDPDAAYSQKGIGYVVHVNETCGNGDDTREILTGYRVDPANKTDQGQAPMLMTDGYTAQLKPEVLYADAGYTSALALKRADEEDIRLYGPISVPYFDDDRLTRADFVFGEDGLVEQCPAGHQPSYHTERKWSDGQRYIHAVFGKGVCEKCPLRERCIANDEGRGNHFVPLVPRLRLRDEQMAQQQDDAWWEDYSIRSGAEATISELTRAHKMRRLRVRRLPKVRLSVGLKMCGCNAKRWIKTLLEQDEPPADNTNRRGSSQALFRPPRSVKSQRAFRFARQSRSRQSRKNMLSDPRSQNGA